MGTAPRMTVAENLLIAKYRGEKRGLKSRQIHLYTEEFQGLIERISNGLEKHFRIHQQVSFQVVSVRLSVF